MFTSYYQTRKMNVGLSLIELMLALAISLMLTGILIEIFLTSLKSHHLEMALNQIQANANKIISIFERQIHQAGLVGCKKVSNDFHVEDLLPYSITTSNQLNATSNELFVRYAEFPGATLTEEIKNHRTMKVTKTIHFSVGDILVIADCKHAEIFYVAAISSSNTQQTLIPSRPLQFEYNKDAEIGRLILHHYFIAKTNRTYPNGAPIYSLFEEDIHQRKMELVEGLYDMTFSYAAIENGKWIEQPANTWMDASQVKGIAVTLKLMTYPIRKQWHSFVAR